MELSSRALKWMQYAVPLLALLTLAVLAWHHLDMERVVDLSAAAPHGVMIADDGSEPEASPFRGEATRSSLEQAGDALRMRCHLGQAFAWPYCKFQFVTGTGGHGLDLSNFDSVTFDIGYTGSGPRKVRLFLINHEPNVSEVPKWASRRFNEVELELPAQGSITIPLNLLHTSEWWGVQAKVPLAQTYTRIDNVTQVELSTGATEPAGDVALELRSIRFHGKWISRDRLLTCIVSVWITCGLLWMALGILHYRATLAASRKHLELLRGINKALELEARELAGQAYTDPLTGALNRQGLRDALVRLMTPAEEHSEGLAVIFADLDHFKKINDGYGHDAGDEVLRRFATMVRANVRASDKLVRWGGEEFLLICPNTNGSHAVLLAEKLRAAMCGQPWPHGLAVTASLGVTELGADEDIGAAISRADGALYRAKAGGRNRVEVA
jgi:diguanylate cyclase (GGDEF)-like protein